LLLLTALVSCNRHATEKTEGEIQGDGGDRIELTPAEAKFLEVERVEKDAGGTAIETTGRVTYDEDHVARLSVPVSGRIARIDVRPGDLVKKDQILAVVHSPDVASAQANLAQDRAQRVQAEQAFARAKRLLEAGAGSQRELDEAKSNLDQAKAAEEKDEAMLKLLGNGSSEPTPVYEIRSPMAGALTERNAAIGGPARPDDPTPLFVVADLSKVWVLVDIFEQDIGLIKKGARVEVTVPAYPDHPFVGEVSQIGDVVNPSSRTVKVRIAMDNRDGALKPEMFARARVQSTGTSSATIPESSVLTKAGRTYVFVQDDRGGFGRREIVLGAREGNKVQVLKGLTPDERIVVKGGLLLDAEMGQRI
jgi:cobalt-zinc-cadmium efflux system membrane fusion protein